MIPSRAYGLLDAVSTVHHAHCDSWNTVPNSSDAHPVIDTGVPEEIAGYAAEARPIYSVLRRIVGQVAGLMILAQAGSRPGALDLPALAAAKELWLSAAEQMGRLRGPTRMDTNVYHLQSTHRLIGTCLESLKLLPRAGERIDLSNSLADIAKAYSHLQSASAPRLGIVMVDFSHACCNCGQLKPKDSVAPGG